MEEAGEEVSQRVGAGTWMGLLSGQRTQSNTMTASGNAGWSHGLGGRGTGTWDIPATLPRGKSKGTCWACGHTARESVTSFIWA